MKKLTSNMMKAAEFWVANPEKTYDEVAAHVGVDPSTLYRWVKDEKFQKYQHDLCLERFKSLEKLAIQKLKENASNNNQRAIEYLLNFAGYKAIEEVDIKSDTGININVNIEGEVS